MHGHLNVGYILFGIEKKVTKLAKIKFISMLQERLDLFIF